MYGEWSPLTLDGGGRGVLGSIDSAGGRDVVLAVVKQLATQPEPSPLNTDAEVEWVLEVIRFGLCLPLTDHEALRDCVKVCCAWLGALLPPAPPMQPPLPPIPTPVSAAPASYARKILHHLHNLFIPRPGESADSIGKQAVLCHWVLRLSQNLAANAELGVAEWRSLLLLLLSASSALLSPPASPHSTADQLCERVLCVLFEVWILACHRCFPSPPLWRTLRDLCQQWRHRPALVEQWARASLCLAARLLRNMYGPLFPIMPINDSDANLIPSDMSPEAVAQAWYRILHTLGNPVDLCRPQIISQTPEFLQYAITQEEGNRDPAQHPCLQALPGIFQKAMKGLAAHVDAFLGVNMPCWWVDLYSDQQVGPQTLADSPTPPSHRRITKSFSVSTSSNNNKSDKNSNKQTDKQNLPDHKGLPRGNLIGLTGSRPVSVASVTSPNNVPAHVELERPPLAPLRPKVNSILHLFGEWLFEAALIGTSATHPPGTNQSRAEGSGSSSLSDLPQKIQHLSYQRGRAEALGALCRVLCSKQSREAVLTAYLARCYAALHRGLRDPHTSSAVLLNAPDLFRLDLEGVLVLVPAALGALEQVLGGAGGGGGSAELRRAALSMLLSLVALPQHLRGLSIPQLPGANLCKGMTFGELGGRVALLCLSGVQADWPPALAAPLLSALYLCVRHAPLPPPGAAANNDSHNSVRSEEESTASSAGSSFQSTPSHSFEDYSGTDVLIRELDPSSPMFGSALVVRSTILVCHRLTTSWKSDLQVSLAALELLAGLAKLHSSKGDGVERKRAVRAICDYISWQCSRPPQAHSRDLHSSVVAAYQCLAAWLAPGLLADRDCLYTVMEVVELGLSGTKSSGKSGELPKMKDEKDIKPVSMRVRDAAESLLMLILEQVGVTPAGGWSRLDERWLARDGAATSASPHRRLRHFLADGSILLSLLEEPLANYQEPQPTLTVIVRGAFGRYAWSLQLRAAPRSAGGRGGAAGPSARPVDMTEPLPQPPPTCIPLVQGPPCAVDSAFPSLDAVLSQLNDPDVSQLFKLLEKQVAIEKEVKSNEENIIPEEYTPPDPVTEFQTARLFLSHFGYLNIGGDQKPSRLVALDGSCDELGHALRRLDATGARAAFTAHVFCCRAAQRNARAIAANTLRADTVTPLFLDMLRGLGWPVRVQGHAGWSGRVDTSYDANPDQRFHEDNEDLDNSKTTNGGAIYDGVRQVLYWADSSSEIAFVVPSDKRPEESEEYEVLDDKQDSESSKTDLDGNCLGNTSDRSVTSCWDVSSAPNVNLEKPNGTYGRSVSESSGNPTQAPVNQSKGAFTEKARGLSLELDKQSSGFGISAGSGRRNRQYTTKILIIWLEDYEDHRYLPIDELLAYAETGQPWRRAEVAVLCVAALRSGLLRVRIAPPAPNDIGGISSGSGLLAGPLVDGALVAPHLLPACLRQTALNIARRRTLHDDSYQPPHARRRLLIADTVQQFRRDLSPPEMLESLFKSPTHDE